MVACLAMTRSHNACPSFHVPFRLCSRYPRAAATLKVLDPDYLESLKREQRNVALYEVIRDAVDGGHLSALQTCLHYAHNHPELVEATSAGHGHGGGGALTELPAMVARCEALEARVVRDHAHWLQATRAALQGAVPNRIGVARYIGQPGKEFAQGLPVLENPNVPGHSFKAVYAKDTAVVLPTGAEFAFSATVTKKHRHKDGHDYDVTFFKLAQVFNVQGLPKIGNVSEDEVDESSPALLEGWVCDLQTDSVKKEPHGTGVLSYFKQKQVVVLNEETPQVRASDLAHKLAIATEGTVRNGVALHLRESDPELLADARVRLGVLKAEEELGKRIAEAMASDCLEPVEECLHLYKVLYVVDKTATATRASVNGVVGARAPTDASTAPSAPGAALTAIDGSASASTSTSVAPLGRPDVAAARALLTQSSSCLPWPYGDVALGFPSPALKRTVTKCEACTQTLLNARAKWKQVTTSNLQAALDATSTAATSAASAANAMQQLEHALEVAHEGVHMHGVRISIADNTALLGRAQIRLAKLLATAEKRTMSAPVVTFAGGLGDEKRVLADKVRVEDNDDEHFFDDIIHTNHAGLLDGEKEECTFQPTLVSSLKSANKRRARNDDDDDENGDDDTLHPNEEGEATTSSNNRHELLYQHAFVKAERLSRAAEEQALAATSANFQPDLSLTAARRAQSANDVDKKHSEGASSSPQQALHRRFEKLFSDQASHEERKAKKAAQVRAAEEAACPFVPSQISKPPAATSASSVENNAGPIGSAVDEANASSLSRTEALYLDAHRRLQSRAVVRESEQAQLKDTLFAPDLSASAKVTAAANVENSRAKSYSDLLATTAVPSNVLLHGKNSAFQRLHLDAAARAARHDANAAQRQELEAKKCTYVPERVANAACNPRKAADVTPTKTEAARLQKIAAQGEMARRKADEAAAARRARALAEIAAVAANGNLSPKAN